MDFSGYAFGLFCVSSAVSVVAVAAHYLLGYLVMALRSDG